MRYTAIMSAMPEEIEGLRDILSGSSEKKMGGRTYYYGLFYGHPVVLVFSRWGKVAAASTLTTLIHEFNIHQLIFTGVAGAVDPKLNVGDIVLASELVQHDMDARPLMPKHEIPLLGKTWFHTDPVLTARLSVSIDQILEKKHIQDLIGDKILNEFSITSPRLFKGRIASGDQFFSTQDQKNSLQEALTDILCVEMEGAAVAQVCYENQLPYTVIRTISDKADHLSAIDFPRFINQVASKYSVAILDHFFRQLKRD
jgi:adenosylhomocysteine nucleosidase